jgi:ABC-type uncharacterized transport system permease subunit
MKRTSELVSWLLKWTFFSLFILYTIISIWWIVAAATKNNAEIFSTFGFFFVNRATSWKTAG